MIKTASIDLFHEHPQKKQNLCRNFHPKDMNQFMGPRYIVVLGADQSSRLIFNSDEECDPPLKRFMAVVFVF